MFGLGPRVRTVAGESRENGQRHTTCLNANLGKQESVEVGARESFSVRMRHTAVPEMNLVDVVIKRRNAIFL